MFVWRILPGTAARLLVGTLTALLTNFRTHLFAEGVGHLSALAACLSQSELRASVVANSSWQHFSADDIGHSRVVCRLNVSFATQYRHFAARFNGTPLSLTPEARMLLRVDRLQFEQRTLGSLGCANGTWVYLSRLVMLSEYLCDTAADRYVWVDDWLTVNIYSRGERPIRRFDAAVVVLSALNVCQAGQHGEATVVLNNVAYAYAPDAWYQQLLQSDNLCTENANYTVRARAANASLLLRVIVLVAPDASACRRLCVDHHCFVAGDTIVSLEAAKNVTIVYAAVRHCRKVEHPGFTLKLESILSPVLHSSSTDGRLSETEVSALVAMLIAVVFLAVIFIFVFITIRKRRHRAVQRSESGSAPLSSMVVSSRGDEIAGVPLSCPDESDDATASIVSAEREISMVDNELYVSSRVG